MIKYIILLYFLDSAVLRTSSANHAPELPSGGALTSIPMAYGLILTSCVLYFWRLNSKACLIAYNLGSVAKYIWSNRSSAARL